MLKIWICNWASVEDAEAVNDDHGVDTEMLANPTGVLLADIADIAKIQKLVVDDDRELQELSEDDFVEGVWVLRIDHPDHKEYGYGESTLLICTLKEVL